MRCSHLALFQNYRCGTTRRTGPPFRTLQGGEDGHGAQRAGDAAPKESQAAGGGSNAG
jgi:hypothetical protein